MMKFSFFCTLACCFWKRWKVVLTRLVSGWLPVFQWRERKWVYVMFSGRPPSWPAMAITFLKAAVSLSVAPLTCQRPTWHWCLWSLQFLILKLGAVQAQIFGSLPQMSIIFLYFLYSCIFNQVGPAALADASTEKEKLVVAVSSSIVHRSRCFTVDTMIFLDTNCSNFTSC